MTHCYPSVSSSIWGYPVLLFMTDSSDIDRRTVLATLGSTTGAVLAGCLGDGGSGDETPGGTPTPSMNGTPDPTPTSTPQATETQTATPVDQETATPTPEPTPTPPDERPGVETSWLPAGVDQKLYQLDASFSNELCQQMLYRRPPDGDASSTTCEFSWEAEVTRESRECQTLQDGDTEVCDCVMKLTSVSVAMDCRVNMPTWLNYTEADESARTEWERFLGQLRQHQLGHLEIGSESLETMRTTLEDEFLETTYEADGPKGQACEKARSEFLAQVEQRFEELVAEYESAQQQYDEETNNGETQGATLDCSV